MEKKTKNPLNKNVIIIVVMVVLLVYALSLIFVLGWGFMTSLKGRIDFRKNPLGLPNMELSHAQIFQLQNYQDVMRGMGMLKFPAAYIRAGQRFQRTVDGSYILYLYNTLMYVGVGAIILAFVPAIGAYMCSKYKCKFSQIQTTVYLLFMMIPIVGTYPSELGFLRATGMYDTFWGNWIQKLHFSGMYFFVYLAFYKGFSDTYAEAAEIDGASQLDVLFRIVIPLSMKTIGSVLLIQVINLWNDYQVPLLYLPTHPTIAYATYLFTDATKAIGLTGEFRGRIYYEVSACMMLALPILVIYIAFNKKLMGDISMGGIKG